jgi:hypothetical protein
MPSKRRAGRMKPMKRAPPVTEVALKHALFTVMSCDQARLPTLSVPVLPLELP